MGTCGSSSTPAWPGGRKGVPEQVAEHPQVFASLTAPSFGAVELRPGEQLHARVLAGAEDSCELSPGQVAAYVGWPRTSRPPYELGVKRCGICVVGHREERL